MSRSARRGSGRGRDDLAERENVVQQIAAGRGNEAQGHGNEKVNPLKTYEFNRTYAEFPDKMVVVPTATAKDRNAWEGMTEDATALCVSGVLRLFLTKGAKGDVVRKADVLKIVKEIDPTYSSVSNSVLQVVHRELKDTFGYNVTVKADPKNKNDNEFIVFNALRSPQLQDILADTALEQDSAWLGFVFVVLQIVNSSAGKAIDFNSLMAKIRELDERFPDTVTKSGSTREAPVPALGADFPSLMKRMVNERYLVTMSEGGSASSSAAANRDEAKVSYTLGPRFFAEIGRRQLVTSYYATLGQKVDGAIFDEAANQEREHQDLVNDVEEGDAGAEEGPDQEKADSPPPAPAQEKRKKRRQS